MYNCNGFCFEKQGARLLWFPQFNKTVKYLLITDFSHDGIISWLVYRELSWAFCFDTLWMLTQNSYWFGNTSPTCGYFLDRDENVSVILFLSFRHLLVNLDWAFYPGGADRSIPCEWKNEQILRLFGENHSIRNGWKMVLFGNMTWTR